MAPMRFVHCNITAHLPLGQDDGGWLLCRRICDLNWSGCRYVARQHRRCAEDEMVSYASKIKRDIDRWVEAGIIGSDTGQKLAADVAQHHRGASLGAMLATMASALLAASILIFIAANWEVIPRLTRVAFLFLLILVGYVSGAILKLREHGTFGEVAWVLAAVSFGAAIALTSQMYHISGDETQALIMWCVGTGFAAAVLQSRYLTVLAALLAICWMTVAVSENASKATSLSLQYLGLGSTVYAISYWTRSRAARQ